MIEKLKNGFFLILGLLGFITLLLVTIFIELPVVLFEKFLKKIKGRKE